MKKTLLFLLLFISPQIFSHDITYLHAKSHTHGIADIAIDWQGTKLIVTAVFSAQDIVGFESIPKNAREKRQVRDAYQKFIDHPVIQAQGCKPVEVKVNSALFDDHGTEKNQSVLDKFIGGNKKHTDNNSNVPAHLDFQATYEFSCDITNKALNFTSFSIFPNIKQARIYKGYIDSTIIQKLSITQTLIQPIGN